MRHRVSHRKLGRVTELRPFVERLITIAKRGLAGGEANGQSLHARRLVLRDIQDRDVVGKLFDTIAPRFETRPGGYTRILRLRYRRGDSAEVAQIELVGSEYNPNAEAEKKATAEKAKPKGVGGRLRAAAERLRGRKEADEAETDESSAKKTKPARPERGPKGGGKAQSHGKASQTRTPRKAGGS